MSQLTKQQMQHTLLAIAKGLPIRKELATLIVAAIGSLSEKDMLYFLRVLGQPTTRWKLMMTLSSSLGADKAFATLSKLPEVQAPAGLRMSRKGLG